MSCGVHQGLKTYTVRRIMRTAAKIILKGIETMAIEISVFPPAGQFCSRAYGMIPKVLQVHMDP